MAKKLLFRKVYIHTLGVGHTIFQLPEKGVKSNHTKDIELARDRKGLQLENV